VRRASAGLRAATGSWGRRWHEFQIFTDPRTKELIEELGIRLIGYKELRRLFRPGSG